VPQSRPSTKARARGQEAMPPALPLTASWMLNPMLRPDQGRSTLGQVLKTMKIGSAKKQVLQLIAGAFPCNSLLHKWGMVSSAACALCGALAETQSHIQCLCPALKDASIQAHHKPSTTGVERHLGCLQTVLRLNGADD
jgi:hypothetical protein